MLRSSPSSMHAAANTPAEPVGARVARFPTAGSLPRYPGRVGFRITRFEACSTFTRVAACMVAEPPAAALCRRSASADVVTSFARSDCYRAGATVARAGFAPAEEWRLVTAHRMDFLLPAHSLVIEVKRIRDKAHAARVGDELIVDMEHYRRHPDCGRLWCAVYDPGLLIRNPAGLVSDLEHNRSTDDGLFSVRVLVVPGAV